MTKDNWDIINAMHARTAQKVLLLIIIHVQITVNATKRKMKKQVSVLTAQKMSYHKMGLVLTGMEVLLNANTLKDLVTPVVGFS